MYISVVLLSKQTQEQNDNLTGQIVNLAQEKEVTKCFGMPMS